MGDLEQRIFKNPQNKPLLYARYVDDTFVMVKSKNDLIHLMNLFKQNSVLNFTYEMSLDGKLPFLDVLVKTTDNKLHTSVYHKPTDQGKCLNARSECTEKYKISVVNNYLNRAYKFSETWQDFHSETMHIKQMLINNSFSNQFVDLQIRKFLEKKCTQTNDKETKNLVPLFYENQMHNNYKIEERIIKNIVYNNTKCNNEKSKLNLIFFYKNRKTSSLVMNNNVLPPPTQLQQTNLIYKFTCPLPHSQAAEYVGFTQTTLSRRLTAHGQNGSIYQHFLLDHNQKPRREDLTENTTIISKSPNRYRLAIKEALLILKIGPSINRQFDNFTNILKLFSYRNQNQKPNSTKSGHFLRCSSNPLALDGPLHNLESTPNNPNVPMTPISYQASPSHAGNFEHYSEPLIPHSYVHLPDMQEILLNFGINPDHFKKVSLHNYQWNRFTHLELIHENEELSISQRVKSMVRNARLRTTDTNQQQ